MLGEPRCAAGSCPGADPFSRFPSWLIRSLCNLLRDDVQGFLEASPNPRLIFCSVPKELTHAKEAAGCGRWEASPGAGCRGEAAFLLVRCSLGSVPRSCIPKAGKESPGGRRENAATCPDQRDLRNLWSSSSGSPARAAMSHKRLGVQWFRT